MHEIITLQLGQQSNYLATHFWNAQESYFTYSTDQDPLVDHDVHFRSGIGADGSETYTPRTVVYDLKGGFGSLRKINALYAIREEGTRPQGVWNGPAVVHEEEAIAPSAYQQSLDAGLPTAGLLTPDTVRYWSDFLHLHLHPRSMVQVDGFQSGRAPFDRWAAGEDLFASLDREHDLTDRDLRLFVEEADHMQALQVFAGFDDAWAGFAARYVERLRDEYGKTSIWVWGSQASSAGVTRDTQLVRLANKARALSDTYRQASVVIPLALPQRLSRAISLDPSCLWHTSAMMAAAVESATLPSRLRDTANRDSLGNMADLLNKMGKQTVAGLQMDLAPTHHHSEGIRLGLDFAPADHVQSASRRRQNGTRKPRTFSQLVTTRGSYHADMPAVEMEGVDGQRRMSPHDTFTRRYHSELLFPLPDSFPAIFKADGGEALSGPVGVTASLSTDSSVSGSMKLLRSTVAGSIGIEDRETISNDLAEMADEYHEGWSSGSDVGDDD